MILANAMVWKERLRRGYQSNANWSREETEEIVLRRRLVHGLLLDFI